MIIQWDQYGYPTEKSLKKLKKKINSKDIQEAIETFYLALHENRYPDATGIEEVEVRGERKKVWGYHTLGWSGNEDIIRVLKTSVLFDVLLERYDAGGHYYFRLKEELVSGV